LWVEYGAGEFRNSLAWVVGRGFQVWAGIDIEVFDYVGEHSVVLFLLFGKLAHVFDGEEQMVV
jgi:hypothetical protein